MPAQEETGNVDGEVGSTWKLELDFHMIIALDVIHGRPIRPGKGRVPQARRQADQLLPSDDIEGRGSGTQIQSAENP